MHQHTIFKQASAVAFGMLLSASAWSVEIVQEFTRAFSGNDIQRIQLIFVVEGDGTSEYVVFAQGPSLVNEGLSADEVLTDPLINLLDSNNNIIDTNDNWGTDSSADRIAEVADFFGITLETGDAAMVRNLGAGLYTVVVVGADGGTGITRVGAADTSDVPGSTEPPAGSCDGLLTRAFYDSIKFELDDAKTREQTDQIIGCTGVDGTLVGVDIRTYTDSVNLSTIVVSYLSGLSFESEFESGTEI